MFIIRDIFDPANNYHLSLVECLLEKAQEKTLWDISEETLVAIHLMTSRVYQKMASKNKIVTQVHEKTEERLMESLK